MIFGRRDRGVLCRDVLLFLPWLLLNQGCQNVKDPVEWGKEHHYAPDETVRIEMGPHNFPVVPGKVNGRAIGVFFDTGNFFGLQIAPRLVRSLRLRPSGNVRKNYASDGAYRYSQNGYRVDSLAVFGTEFRDIEMFEMADGAFEASVGVRDLAGGRFTIDYRNRLMGASRASHQEPGTGNDELPLIWNDRLPGMIVVEGWVDGLAILLQIDTGKSRTTIDEELIALAGLEESRTLFQHGYKVDRIAIGRRGFSVGHAKVANFQAISEGYPRPILMGIGADILSRVVLTVDYPRKKVLIE